MFVNASIDPTVENFHLTSVSPAIDNGANTLSPQSQLTDFDGVVRPQGAGYDIGAYEYTGVQNTPTATPTSTPTPTPKPGDANGDGKVDETDYSIWLSHFGQVITGVTNGDFNGDGHADGIDYTIWLNNYTGD